MDDDQNQAPRWVNIQYRDLFAVENNEDIISDSDESDFNDIDPDESGYDSGNPTEGDNDAAEMVDEPAIIDDPIVDVDENETAYVMVDRVQEESGEMLLQMMSWNDFKCRFVDEIHSRHINGEMEIVFERLLWVVPENYEYWTQKILQLQKQIPNLIPNFRIWDDTGNIMNECQMFGSMSHTHSPLETDYYKITIKVHHKAEIRSFTQ